MLILASYSSREKKIRFDLLSKGHVHVSDSRFLIKLIELKTCRLHREKSEAAPFATRQRRRFGEAVPLAQRFLFFYFQ